MIDRRPIKDAHPLRSFVFDNIARVGDAVHAMAPTRRGGCESLVDGLTLGEA